MKHNTRVMYTVTLYLLLLLNFTILRVRRALAGRQLLSVFVQFFAQFRFRINLMFALVYCILVLRSFYYNILVLSTE